MSKRTIRIVCIVGSDGVGKSTLSRFVIDELRRRGVSALLLWSRYNNFWSRPLLLLARIFGHSYYRKINGVRTGFHEFEKTWWLKWPFAWLQMVDAKRATARILEKEYPEGVVLVFERSCWDTLIDVAADTGMEELICSKIGAGIVSGLAGRSEVLWIDRQRDLIVASRPELKEDIKLSFKLSMYADAAEHFGWTKIMNNGSLSEAKKQLCEFIDGMNL